MQEQRTYNSAQLAAKLEQEREVRLSADRKRLLLKKRGSDGNAPAPCQHGQQDPVQKLLLQADLAMLELAAQDGYIDLKYLDESGFCLWSPVSYSYSRVSEQKRLEQVPRRGKRISILGLWQPDQRFEYALAQGGFDGESYIQVMDWLADSSAITLEQTGRFTVVVQDNGSLHKRGLVQQQWQRLSCTGLVHVLLTALLFRNESH